MDRGGIEIDRDRDTDRYYTRQIDIPARTAQGGGGSFKERKPIGEIGWYDAWMAEQIH